MSDQEKIEASNEEPQHRRGKPISVESIILMFGLFTAIFDREVLERGFKLALRSPDLLGEKLREFFISKGTDIDTLLGAEAATPPSKAEVLAFADPALKRGVEAAVWAQIADIYFFNTERSPENLVYAFYNGVRFVIAGEVEPTKEQSNRIWDLTLLIARSSKIGAPHWKNLEEESPIALKNWLEPIKETARKRYKTFLSRKRRAERTAEESLKAIMADMFGEDDNP
jgi:hypothetical protein